MRNSRSVCVEYAFSAFKRRDCRSRRGKTACSLGIFAPDDQAGVSDGLRLSNDAESVSALALENSSVDRLCHPGATVTLSFAKEVDHGPLGTALQDRVSQAVGAGREVRGGPRGPASGEPASIGLWVVWSESGGTYGRRVSGKGHLTQPGDVLAGPHSPERLRL